MKPEHLLAVNCWNILLLLLSCPVFCLCIIYFCLAEWLSASSKYCCRDQSAAGFFLLAFPQFLAVEYFRRPGADLHWGSALLWSRCVHRDYQEHSLLARGWSGSVLKWDRRGRRLQKLGIAIRCWNSQPQDAAGAKNLTRFKKELDACSGVRNRGSCQNKWLPNVLEGVSYLIFLSLCWQGYLCSTDAWAPNIPVKEY